MGEGVGERRMGGGGRLGGISELKGKVSYLDEHDRGCVSLLPSSTRPAVNTHGLTIARELQCELLAVWNGDTDTMKKMSTPPPSTHTFLNCCSTHFRQAVALCVPVRDDLSSPCTFSFSASTFRATSVDSPTFSYVSLSCRSAGEGDQAEVQNVSDVYTHTRGSQLMVFTTLQYPHTTGTSSSHVPPHSQLPPRGAYLVEGQPRVVAEHTNVDQLGETGRVVLDINSLLIHQTGQVRGRGGGRGGDNIPCLGC